MRSADASGRIHGKPRHVCATQVTSSTAFYIDQPLGYAKDLAKGFPQPEHFEARLILFPCALLLAAWLVLSVDNMKTSLSGREPLNGAAEPGRDLLEIDVLDVTKSVRAKNRCNASRLETAGPTFINFLKLFGPLRY